MTLDINLQNVLELIENDVEKEIFASVSLNPNYTWVTFILTDDRPNENKHRIPKEEFANVIKTGMFMPIKMALGEIKVGHTDARPIGVVTHLKEEGNKIKGLAALWNHERPDDVGLVKQQFSDKNPLNLSWELHAVENPKEDGTVELTDVIMNATTLVGMPAYAGRTPVLQVASKQNRENTMDEKEIEKLQSDLAAALAEVAAKETLQKELDEVKASLEAVKTELETLKAERDQLATFKAEAEKKVADEAKFATIKEKFTKAELEVTDEYFAEKKDTLMAMDDTALDFMIQELVNMKKTVVASKKSIEIPQVFGHKDNVDIKELGRLLRESDSK